MIGGISYFHEFAYDLIAENERILASTFDAAIAARRSGRLERIVVDQLVDGLRVGDRLPDAGRRAADSPPPISTYGFQKLASEYFAKGALEQYQLPYTILRPFNCVGIGERRAVRDTDIMSGNVKLALSHVVPDLVLKALQGQDPLHILGEGNQVRHYTYGGDLARGIRLAMESPKAVNDDFNLSTATSTTVLELAEAIWRKVHGADGAGGAVQLRLRPALRARRPAPRAGRSQGPRGARVRGDHHARRDARRGHPVDPGRGGGGPPVTKPLGVLYESRFNEREAIAKIEVWREIVEYLSRWIDPTQPVLDVACDRGYFLRWVVAPRRIATDIREMRDDLPADVEFVRASALDLEAAFEGMTFGTIFMSNYLEHLDSSDIVVEQLRIAAKLLAPGGNLVILQPNIRLVGQRYWDFIDHHVPLTERSLVEATELANLRTVELIPRFLPYSTKGRLPLSPLFVRAYLRFPPAWWLMGKQTLYVGTPI